jgi:hypothetical protein
MSSIGISLGYNCQSAMKGVDSNVRKSKQDGYRTCPFDLINTNYQGLILCLKEDFKHLCDIKYLIIKYFPLDDKYYPGENIICNTRYGFIFNHESPGHANLYNIEKWEGGITHFTDNNYKKFIERYEHRIKNFREYIYSGNVINFLLTSQQQDLTELHDIFKNKFVYEILRYDVNNTDSYNYHMKLMSELKTFKVLVLIISDDSNKTYQYNRDIWRIYMNINPIFHCVFITASPIVTLPYLDNDTLYVSGEESFIPGIFEKTVKAIEYFKDHNYDYILRTNLSSVFNLNKLEMVIQDFPRDGLYAGINIDNSASGAGMLMSKDVYMILLDPIYKDILHDVIDDIKIGWIMRNKDVILTPLIRQDITGLNQYIDKRHYHYRCKQVDRTHEAKIMEQVVESIYYNKPITEVTVVKKQPKFIWNKINMRM